MSPFKMNNPGCPCCDNCPCACYPFNGNFRNNSGYAPSSGIPTGAHSFVAGKHGLGLKIPHIGLPATNVVKVPHHKCFSLEGGFSVWFWLYSDPTCDTDGDGTYSGAFEDIGTVSYVLSKGTALDLVNDPPEWLFGFPVNKRCNGSSGLQIAYGAGNPAGTSLFFMLDDNYNQNWEDGGGGLGPAPASWEFHFMYYDPNIGANGTMYLSIDAAQWQTNALPASTIPTNPSKPLCILESVGVQAQYFIIDELGFCKDIPPVNAAGDSTLTQMKARCTALFNAGAGKACNHYK